MTVPALSSCEACSQWYLLGLPFCNDSSWCVHIPFMLAGYHVMVGSGPSSTASPAAEFLACSGSCGKIGSRFDR